MAVPTQLYFLSFNLACLYSCVMCFNIEERIPIVKIGPDGSLFGLSIAQHHIYQDSTTTQNSVLLVGAPTDERAPQHSTNVKKPGGLYKCSVSFEEEECTRVIVSPGVSSPRINSSDQWLGVSLKSQKPGGKIVVCAHRYTIRGEAQHWEAVIGRCFLLESNVHPVADSLNFDYTPCLGKPDPNGRYSQEYYGYCQAGTSVTFADVPYGTDTENYLVFGAPGSFIWTGAVYTTEMKSALWAIGKEAWSQEEPEPGPIGKNSLLGSSVTSGPLFGSRVYYVSGAPGANVTGAVAILKKVASGSEERLEVVEILFGDRVASRFGNEVVLVDVTGDGLLDLVVGAPQYFDRADKLGGAVYIYVNKGTSQIGPRATQKLFGEADSAFGISITSIGDINMDGVLDIAVGAPGADSGKGAIYIFHGNSGESSEGVHAKATQIIRAANLISSGYVTRNITGMGYSISGGLDMDFNGYPDVAVGSLSDSILLFQSRPIVSLIGTIKLPMKEILITKGSKLEYNISVCLRYTSLSDWFDGKVAATWSLSLDATRLKMGLISRASFSLTDRTDICKSGNMMLFRQSRNKTKCKVLKVYISDDIQDKLSPVKLQLTFSTSNVLPKRSRRQIQSPTWTPVMNITIQNVTTQEIRFAQDCGEDQICKSNLSVTAYYQHFTNQVWTDLTLNEDEIPVLKLCTNTQIGIVINVSNLLGDDAHQAGIRVRLPKHLSLQRFDVLDGSGSELHCNGVVNETSIYCSLGNPFKTNTSLNFRLKLSKRPSIYQATHFEVELQLQTTSVQSGHDNIKSYPAIIKVEAQLIVDGKPSKDQVRFGGMVVGESAVKRPEDAGTIFSHWYVSCVLIPPTRNFLFLNSYEVTNIGTAQADNVVLRIRWPQSIKNGKWLFYLLDAKVRNDNGNCSVSTDVNPLGLRMSLNRKKRSEDDADYVEHDFEESQNPSDSLYKTLDCGSISCIEFDCFLGTISTLDPTRHVDINAVLWNSTFLEEYRRYSQIHVQSSAEVTIPQDNIKFSEKSRLAFKVSTDVLSEVPPVPPVAEVGLWIIMVAVAAGVILLVLIVLLLWKLGFFRRNKSRELQKPRRHKQASLTVDEMQSLF